MLIDESGNLNSERASKSSKSTASSVSSAKRDIQRKADKLLHLIETQYDKSRETSSLTLVSEMLTKSCLAELKTDLVLLDLVLLPLN